LVGNKAVMLGLSGFGQEVRKAMEARIEHLISQGLARRQGQRVIFARDLLDTLRQRDLEAATAQLASSTALPYRRATEGEAIAGTCRRRVDLASGRLAMIDGLGFILVRWKPSLERYVGQHVSGVAKASGIDWTMGRKRTLEIS